MKDKTRQDKKGTRQEGGKGRVGMRIRWRRVETKGGGKVRDRVIT